MLYVYFRSPLIDLKGLYKATLSKDNSDCENLIQEISHKEIYHLKGQTSQVIYFIQTHTP